MEATQITSDIRIRKFSPIDRDYPIFEVLVGDKVILDVSKDENGNDEIAFHDAVSNRVIRVCALLEIIEECKAMMEAEEVE